MNSNNCISSRRKGNFTFADDSTICGRQKCSACAGMIKGNIVSRTKQNDVNESNVHYTSKRLIQDMYNDQHPLLSKSVDMTIIDKLRSTGQHSNPNAKAIDDDGKNHQHRRRCCYLRYIVCSVVIFAIAMNNYANLTLNISTIAMISNDVLQSGLTELRAEHMSADPLAAGRDAALPGTCPTKTNSLWSQQRDKVANFSAIQQQTNITLENISQSERDAMSHDAAHLLADVNDRIANGQLVDWSISQRGFVYTAHNVGGILMALPIGYLTLNYGAKSMISLGVITTALRMLLLPAVASHAPFWMTVVFEFVFGGPGQTISLVIYPLAAAWLLPNEANAFIAFIQLANLAGNSATNFITGQMLANGIGWCWCFYVPGILASILALLWLILGADQPEESRFISQDELELLKFSLHNLDKIKRHKQTLESRHLLQKCVCSKERVSNLDFTDCPARQMRRKPDWGILFRCPIVWSMIAASFASHWCRKLRTILPTFLSNIMHLDAATVGMVIGLQGACAAIFGLNVIYATRKFVTKPPFGISLTAYRRINQIIATSVLGLTIAIITIFDCEIGAHIAYAAITPFVTSFDAISYDQMPLDLSVEDSGLLVSTIRSMGIGEIIALPVSSKILSLSANKNLPAHLQSLSGNRYTWQLVWFLTLGIKVFACIWFVLVARSEPRSYSHLEPVGECKSIKNNNNNNRPREPIVDKGVLRREENRTLASESSFIKFT